MQTIAYKAGYRFLEIGSALLSHKIYICFMLKKLYSAMKSIYLICSFILCSVMACGHNDNQPELTPSVVTFAKGADVSWLTEMEKSGVKFYNSSGHETECMTLLRNLGMNSVRLRVWVNPSDGWCNKNDLLVKAKRAKQLGMRIMIDFHYSDSWADPSQQMKPAAWLSYSIDQLKSALTNHTEEVLNALKLEGITPEWVQVGNEIAPGMLWDTDAAVSGATYNVEKDGKTYAKNETNFAMFIATGAKAVKKVFPSAKVIVHLHGGNDNAMYRWIFDILKVNNVDYDVIGMSLYPSVENWNGMVVDCVSNMKDMISRYGKEVMICEVGMPWNEADTAKSFLTELMTQSKAIDKCLGIFYWEPEAYAGWKGYTLGAFSAEGRPTVALDAFK